MGIAVRWGGDWDHDGKSKDEQFLDLGHFELC
jgi:peptidoglycan L-alanyl-D-glutamate endopeptidase CwlK